jgi:hypothetical protein
MEWINFSAPARITIGCPSARTIAGSGQQAGAETGAEAGNEFTTADT